MSFGEAGDDGLGPNLVLYPFFLGFIIESKEEIKACPAYSF